MPSRDGTSIAVWVSGEGPPLVLVHGTTADHTRWRPLLPYLEPHLTVHAIDRRGRGASGDASDYDPAREFDDVAAVVDAVAEASARTVDVLGDSFGGFCALGAAALTRNLRRLVLYEPALRAAGESLSDDIIGRMERLLAAGEREATVELMMREIVRMPEDELVSYRDLPSWPARIAAAHTIPRELHATGTLPFDKEKAAAVSERAACRHRRPAACRGPLAPETFAGLVLAFLGEDG